MAAAPSWGLASDAASWPQLLGRSTVGVGALGLQVPGEELRGDLHAAAQGGLPEAVHAPGQREARLTSLTELGPCWASLDDS
uniref:Uncharacterized protein n=1 Tax=Suricata suricatta TaxID=37032 RepID=A0A673UL44_SURSU